MSITSPILSSLVPSTPLQLGLTAAAAATGSSWFVPLLVSLLLQNRYDVTNPEGRVIDTTFPEPEYDFVVIGAGSAGSVVASRLSENPEWKVLLLEAGGDESELSDVPILAGNLQLGRLDWQFKTEPQPTACLAMKHWRCNWPRGKVLGGSSVLNYMVYVRGNKRDYDNWEKMGNYGWGYRNVLHYFKKSEDNQNPYVARNTEYHSTGGYLTVGESPYRTPVAVAFVEAGIEMGYESVDINAERQTGFVLPQGTIRRGARCSAAKAFLRPARNRPNLHISMRSYVHKILIDKNMRAYGVKYEKFEKIQVVRARKEVILSAGSITTPSILMLSGIGDCSHLKEVGVPCRVNLKVGHNLQDHIGIGGLTFVLKKPVAVIESRFVNAAAFAQYMFFGRGPLTTLGALDGLSFINTKYQNVSELDWPDMQFHFTSGTAAADGGRQIRRIHGLNNRVWHEYYKPLSFRDTWTAFPTLLRPRSKGLVRLRSKNPRDYPLLYHNYLTDPDDVARLVEGMKLAVVMSETNAFKRLGSHIYTKPFPGCEQHKLWTDGYFECLVRHYTETIYHYAGTAKMGPYWDPDAVVDPELRVYGVKRLRVADCSIMPIIVSGNTNAPAIMIGEKLADMVKYYWGYVE